MKKKNTSQIRTIGQSLKKDIVRLSKKKDQLTEQMSALRTELIEVCDQGTECVKTFKALNAVTPLGDVEHTFTGRFGASLREEVCEVLTKSPMKPAMVCNQLPHFEKSRVYNELSRGKQRGYIKWNSSGYFIK